jgi:hypothetical protein
VPGILTVAFADLFRGAVPGLALQFLRMFAAGLLRAGMPLGVTVTLSDLLGGAVFGLAFQILRLLTTFRSFTHRTVLLNGQNELSVC